MKNSVIIVMFCIASGLIAAQETIDFSQMDSPRIFSEQYYQFIKSRDYSGRGYKWTGRWLWNSQFRQGQAQNAAEYLRAARTLDSYRSKRDIPLSQSGWSPVGPRTLGRSYDTASGHGIGRINCVAFHPSDPNTLWIGSPHGGIWKSTTGGQSWIPQGDELPVTAISDICVDPNDPDIIYISTGDYGVVSHLSQFSLFGNGFGMGVFKSTNGGDSWAPTGLSFELSDYQTSLTRRVFVHPDNSDGLIAAGTSGVFVSSDAGETWQNTFKNMIWDIEKNPANPDVLYAYSFNEPFRPSADRRLIKSTDFGATWDTLNIDLPADSVWRCELAISPIDNDLIYLVASNNRNGFFGLYCSTDAGESWERRSSHEEINILDWYAGTLRGGQASYDLTIICDREDKDRIYVGGVNLWGSTDGGRTWDIISHWADFFGESLHADQHFSAFNPLDGKYYFCNDGGITRTSAVHIGRKDSSVARIDPETERPCEGTPEYRFPT
ncbi:MAG: WD40/YVTN/BNR-like repeat-containing protein, partial [Bacteroidota bacterium]